MPVDCSQPLSSCNYDQWQPTVSNWLEANVDGELSSFAFDMVTDAPTGTLKNTWPTKLPRIGTGPSNRTDAVGIAGKLMAAAGGGISANCSILEGSNGQCGRPPSVQDSCKPGLFDNFSSRLTKSKVALCLAGHISPGKPYITWSRST